MGSALPACLAGLITGILLACHIPGDRIMYYLVPLVALLGVIAIWAYKRLNVSPVVRSSLMIGFGCFLVAGQISVRTQTYDPIPGRGLKTDIRARILSYREPNARMGQLVLKLLSEKRNGKWERQSGRLVLLVKPDPAIRYRIGDDWEFSNLKVVPVSDKPTPNGFVPSRYWLSRGVRHEARAGSSSGRWLDSPAVPSVKSLMERWQAVLSGHIDAMPMSASSRALVKAMVLGDRSDVESETITDFSRAGVIHVLSVSGLHVGIIYFLISFLLSLASINGGKGRSLAILLIIWLYAGITGFSPSAVRSAGMITLFEVARIFRRGTPGLLVLASTAFIHCLLDPFTVFSAGAQLSYLAVAGIFVWNPVFNPVLARQNRIVRYFGGTIAISLSAQCLIIPVLIFWFGWFPLYFLIGNLFLLPLMVLSFYLGLALSILNLAGISIPLAYKGMDLITGLSLRGAELLGNLPGNLFEPKGMQWTDLLMYYLAFWVVRSYLDRPEPSRIKLLLAGIGMLIVLRMLIPGL